MTNLIKWTTQSAFTAFLKKQQQTWNWQARTLIIIEPYGSIFSLINLAYERQYNLIF